MSVRIPLFVSVFFVLSFVQCLFAAHGQEQTPNLTGVVEDTTGSVVIGTNITLRDSAGRVVASGKSDSTGRFALSFVPRGSFNLTA